MKGYLQYCSYEVATKREDSRTKAREERLSDSVFSPLYILLIKRVEVTIHRCISIKKTINVSQSHLGLDLVDYECLGSYVKILLNNLNSYLNYTTNFG